MRLPTDRKIGLLLVAAAAAWACTGNIKGKSPAAQSDAGVPSDAAAGAYDLPPGASPDMTTPPTKSAADMTVAATVAAPTFVRNLDAGGENGWYGSPAVADLDGDGRNEVVFATGSTWFYAASGVLIAQGSATQGRAFAPVAVADLDGDGRLEAVVGGEQGTVAAYDLAGGKAVVKWTASTCSGGQCPETRGLAVADLDGNGTRETVATTTDTAATGAQVFVFDATGKVRPGWPRYDQTDDLAFNGAGNHGAGCYGENVAVGNVDDTPDLEVIVGNDDHELNVFRKDGSSVLASSYYLQPLAPWVGQRMGWGQFIRWLDPAVEATHYHELGAWPDINATPWLQWSVSPPAIADVDGDGKNDVIGIPNVEQYTPYRTIGYAVAVFHGAQDAGAHAAERLAAFASMPFTDAPVPDEYADYPPVTLPAPTVVALGDARPAIVFPGGDGAIWCYGSDGKQRFRTDYAHGKRDVYASEVVVADLDKDGTPELVFGTYGPSVGDGRLVILSDTGATLHDVALPGQQANPNAVGAGAAPTIADVDGDGQLEVLVATFDHGVDVFTVAGSGTDAMPWPTARGSWARTGAGPATRN